MFGAYVSEAWRLEKYFFGTAESFLFTARPVVEIFPWSHGNNRQFVLAQFDALAVGGGYCTPCRVVQIVFFALMIVEMPMQTEGIRSLARLWCVPLVQLHHSFASCN